MPETAPTPLQKHYVLLSVPVLILGAIAITALELGAPLGSPLVKLCVLVAAPLLVVTTADAVGPDLAIGLGVDAGRSGEGPVPPRLGRDERRRAGRADRRGRRSPSSRDRDRAIAADATADAAELLDAFGRGPDAPLDRHPVRRRRPVVDGRDAQLLLALRDAS